MLALTVRLPPNSAVRIGMTKPNCLEIVTFVRTLACGLVGQGATGAPAKVSHETVMFEAAIVLPEPCDSAMIAQPILFVGVTGPAHVPVYDEGSRAPTRAPARAAFSTVICV